MAVKEFETFYPSPKVAAVPREPIWRLSVAQYREMLDAGILQSDDPIELLEGWLVYKMAKNPPHPVAVKLLEIAFAKIVPEGWFVRQQDPITFEESEPEPDIAIIVGTVRQYVERHPIPAEVALIVEVSDSTLERDRDVKQRIYARGRIPFYWIINLVDEQIEVYSAPTGYGEHAKYLRREIFQRGDSFPVIVDNKQIGIVDAADVLP